MTVDLTLDPSDPRFVTGTDDTRRQARDEFRRQQRLHIAMRSTLPELPRSDLAFHKFGIEDIASGNYYKAIRGELTDPNHSAAVGYYINELGDPVYLERPVGSPQNRDELNELRAEREQRRQAAPVRARGRG
jgi:hypothetical protein